MKSATLGSDTSDPEVTNVSQHGFWLLLAGEELFLPFDCFPWFRDAARSAEHTSELQALMRISYAVFCLQKKRTLSRGVIRHNRLAATPIRKSHTRKCKRTKPR